MPYNDFRQFFLIFKSIKMEELRIFLAVLILYAAGIIILYLIWRLLKSIK